jgi:hypothetical protein
VDENGDTYIYDDSTENEYLYIPFSKDTNRYQYQPYGTPYDFFIRVGKH